MDDTHPSCGAHSLKLELRTRLAHRIVLRLMAIAAAMLAFMVALQPPSLSQGLFLAVLVFNVYVLLDHAARVIQFRDDGVQLRWLLGWRRITLSRNAFLRSYRKQWFVFDPPHRGARFVIYPEFFGRPTDVESLKGIVPEEPSA